MAIRDILSRLNPDLLGFFTENTDNSKQLVQLALSLRECESHQQFLASKMMVTKDTLKAIADGEQAVKPFGVQKILERFDVELS